MMKRTLTLLLLFLLSSTVVFAQELTLDQIAARDPRAKDVNPEAFMDVRFVKQLEESGFIQGLYAGR